MEESRAKKKKFKVLGDSKKSTEEKRRVRKPVCPEKMGDWANSENKFKLTLWTSGEYLPEGVEGVL